MARNDGNSDTSQHRGPAAFTRFVDSLIENNDHGKHILPYKREEVLKKAHDQLAPEDVPTSLTAVSKTARRLLAERNNSGRKPKRDPRFVQEEKEAWEWHVHMTNLTAVAKKKKTTSAAAIARDLISSGIQNVINDTVFIGGVQAHVTNDMKAIARQGLSRRLYTPAEIEVIDDLEYAPGCGHSGRTQRMSMPK